MVASSAAAKAAKSSRASTAASTATTTRASSSSSSSSSARLSSSAAAGGGGGGGGPLPPPVNQAETLQGIPPQFAPKIEAAVERLVTLMCAPGWEQMYEEDGMVAMQKPGSILCVRGDLQMPFGVGPIFDIIMDTSRNAEINPQVASSLKNLSFSPNTATQHLKFKAVWPTSARDLVNLTHWRLLPDGRVVIISFSEKAFDADNPPDAGSVRADLLIGGYVLTPQGNGSTAVCYVVQSDLKGTIPTAVATFVARGQPRIVLNIRAALDKAARSQVLNPIVPGFSGEWSGVERSGVGVGIW